MGSIRTAAVGSAAVLVSVALCASAQQPVAAPHTKIADIPYAVVEGRELGLDLYLPAAVETPPLLVWIHGGRWLRRTKADVYSLALVAEGFGLASVDFRLAVDAPFPAQIHD
ncbi:MAG: hypothetical protein OXF98_06410, partial [Rhodospirillaceae bacterium]|nr:hypothetical protein [Rhodospirillaceae bacterium]